MGNKQNWERIGRRKLEELAECISERDKAILGALEQYHYLTTNQIQRLYFRQSISKLAALRATNRNLLRLEEWRLITPLKRRIGGVRAGSGAYVWVLSPVGARLLNLLIKGSDSDPVRKRMHEPAPSFLQHTLAVAEVSIRLTEIAAKHKLGLLERQVEPNCWRTFTNVGGTTTYLKPDLYAVAAVGDYEDHWFIEVDLATESPVVVVRKCQQYLTYRQYGNEQQNTGVFPLVVWIVPDGKRKESLQCHITESLPDDFALFVVVMMDELEQLVLSGAKL